MKQINWPKYVIGAITLATCIAIIIAIVNAEETVSQVVFSICLMAAVFMYAWWLHMHNHRFVHKIQAETLAQLSCIYGESDSQIEREAIREYLIMGEVDKLHKKILKNWSLSR